MATSIIGIGNPGAGKSTFLNGLAREILFKSGISIGNGLTYQLDERKNEEGTFLTLLVWRMTLTERLLEKQYQPHFEEEEISRSCSLC